MSSLDPSRQWESSTIFTVAVRGHSIVGLCDRDSWRYNHIWAKDRISPIIVIPPSPDFVGPALGCINSRFIHDNRDRGLGNFRSSQNDRGISRELNRKLSHVELCRLYGSCSFLFEFGVKILPTIVTGTIYCVSPLVRATVTWDMHLHSAIFAIEPY